MIQGTGRNNGSKGRLLVGWWKWIFGLIALLGLVMGVMLAQVKSSLSEELVWFKPVVNPCSISFSPDGKYLASPMSFGLVGIFRVTDGTLVRTLTGHTDWVLSVSFSPDGSLIASGSRDRTIKIWRVTDGSLVRTLTGHTYGVLSVTFSPDGSLIASGSWDNTIKIWRVKDGSLVRTLTGHTYGVLSVTFSPDGSLIASGSEDNTIKIWRVKDGSLVRTLTRHKSGVWSVAFSPDGSLIASGGWGGLALWRVGAPINRPLTQFVKGSEEAIREIVSLLKMDDGVIISADYFKNLVNEQARQMIIDLIISIAKKLYQKEKISDIMKKIPKDKIIDIFPFMPDHMSSIELISQGWNSQKILDELEKFQNSSISIIEKKLEQIDKNNLSQLRNIQLQKYLKDLEKRKLLNSFLIEINKFNKITLQNAKNQLKDERFLNQIKRYTLTATKLGIMIIPLSWPISLSLDIFSTLKGVSNLDIYLYYWTSSLFIISFAENTIVDITHNTIKALKIIEKDIPPIIPEGQIIWYQDFMKDHDKFMRDIGIRLNKPLGIEAYSVVKIKNTGKVDAEYRLIVQYSPEWGNIPITIITDYQKVRANDEVTLRINYTEPEYIEALLPTNDKVKLKQYKGIPPSVGGLFIVYLIGRTETGLYGIEKHMQIFSPLNK
mgnify:CR=1 FL=1